MGGGISPSSLAEPVFTSRRFLAAMRAHFRCVTLDAAQIAMSLGSAKCMNIVLFGAMSRVPALEHIHWEAAIAAVVPPQFLELNLAAYRAGRDAAR